MENSWKTLMHTGLTVSSCIFVSLIIMSVGFYYSLALPFIVAAQLTAGSLAAYLMLFFMTGEGGINIFQDYWHILLLGATVAVVVTASFMCVLPRYYFYKI